MKAEKRVKLNEILGELDPEGAREIEIRERFSLINAELTQQFNAAVEYMKGLLESAVRHINSERESHMEKIRESLNERLSALESSQSSLSTSQILFKGAIESAHKKNKEEMSKMLKDEITSQKNDTDEKLKELAIALKRVGFGGGSMPRLLYIETPVSLADGTTTAFTLINKPTYITVGGQMMINGDGYTLTGTSPWTATFDFPPQSGQTIHSFWQ